MDNNVLKALNVIEQVNNVILGKDKQIKEIMAAFLAGGHILLEDIPGVGKTTAARLVLEAAKTMEHSPFGEEAPFVETEDELPDAEPQAHERGAEPDEDDAVFELIRVVIRAERTHDHARQADVQNEGRKRLIKFFVQQAEPPDEHAHRDEQQKLDRELKSKHVMI